MGNYKEGYVQLWLRPDTPTVVVESLVDLVYFSNDKGDSRVDRIAKLKEIKKDKFFKGNLQRLVVEIDPTIEVGAKKYRQTLDLNAYVTHSYCIDHYITDFSMFESLYCDDKFTSGIGITAVKEALKKRRFVNLCVSARVNSKQYTTELEDLVGYLKPYVIQNHPNKVGHIKDEDGYINKDIYLDIDLIKKVVETRKYLCEGCDDFKQDIDCPHWNRCYRAYNLYEKKYKKSKK